MDLWHSQDHAQEGGSGGALGMWVHAEPGESASGIQSSPGYLEATPEKGDDSGLASLQ